MGSSTNVLQSMVRHPRGQPNNDSGIINNSTISTNIHANNVCNINISNSRDNVDNFQVGIDIKVCLLNCCGLKTKTLANDFEYFINNYDIICLSETKLDQLDIVTFGEFNEYFKCRKGARRSSGGIAVLVKKHLSKLITLLNNEDDFTLWFKMENIIGGKSSLFCIAYIPPDNSSYSSIDLFDVIEYQYMQFEHMSDYFFLFGDFNARTGTVCDYNELNGHIADSLLIEEDDKDIITLMSKYSIPLDRTSEDKVLNKYGKRFIELCSNLGILIMNGRCGKDVNIGKCTCDGRSVVDYVVCSPELFDYCEKFEVLDFDCLLSDKHCPIIFNLYQSYSATSVGNENVDDRTDGLSKNIMSLKWSPEKCSLFRSHIGHCQINAIINTIDKGMYDGMSQSSLNTIVSEIGDLFRESAKNSDIMKISNKKTKLTKRKLPKKPWFNSKCEIRRSNYFKCKNKYNKFGSEVNHINMKISFKLYRKSLRNEYVLYHKDLNSRLKKLKNTNPKQYWKLLISNDNSKTVSKLNFNELSKYFEILNKDDPIMNSTENVFFN